VTATSLYKGTMSRVGATVGCAGAQLTANNTTTRNNPRNLKLGPMCYFNSPFFELFDWVGLQSDAVLGKRMSLPPFSPLIRKTNLHLERRVAEPDI